MNADLSFYLTQRLSRREFGSGAGFDAFFSCDYMGSAEFEWGSLPESLRNMRAASHLGIHQGRVTRNGVTVPVFVVGDLKVIERVPDELTRWMTDAYPSGKERTHFPEQVEGVAEQYALRTHAWWSLSDDVMWALDADTADLLLKAVTSR